MASLCDANVWVALAIAEHVHQRAAREWFAAVEEQSSVFFCRATQTGFLRLLSTASVCTRYGHEPRTNRQAWNLYEAFLSDDRVEFCAEEPAGVEVQWQAFSNRNAPSPKLWMDAYLAAFAVANGWQLVTTDRAFTQFPGLHLLLLT